MAKQSNTSPLLFPALSFLTGMTLSFFFSFSFYFSFSLCFSLYFSLFLLHFRKIFPLAQSALILFTFFSIGILRVQLESTSQENHPPKSAIWHLEILEVINSHSFLVNAINDTHLHQKFNLKLAHDTSLFIDDEGYVIGNLIPFPEPSALKPFNPKDFFANKNCYSQIFASTFTKTNSASSLSNYFAKTQHQLANVFNRFLSDSTEAGIMKALVLGNTQDLSFESKTAFANAGISHILAVSGMHVALIYQVVKLFLNFLFRKKRRKGLFLFIGAFAVWFFAALTGFSASVTRAAFMITFFVIIDAMQWRYAKTNVVAGSLLLLAFYDPFLFKQLGFQLSLAAVLGILFLYPHLKIQVSNKKWIQYAFDFCLVSLVAQLATLPITLATFHSFPTYFLFANILCVPLSTFLIYAGIALLLLQSVPIVNEFISMLLHYALHAFIEIVKTINQFPFQKLNNIPFNSFQEILFLLGLILLGISFESRWKTCRKLSYAAIAFSLTFQIRTSPPIAESNLLEDNTHIHYFIKHPENQYNKLLQLKNFLETNRIFKPVEVHLIPPYHSLEISP